MLRIFLAGPLRADTAVEWVRYAEDGHAIARGRDVQSRWPAASEIGIVLAAGATRLVALSLPPMAGARVAQAVRYAVEDQMASTLEESALAIHDDAGRVLVAIAAKSLVEALAPAGARVRSVVPECALAPVGDGWRWYRSSGGGGFVRRDDGSAFAVDDVPDGLPGELHAALMAARSAGSAPKNVRVSTGADAGKLDDWTRETGIRFAQAAPWHWADATAEALRAAPDFSARDTAAAPRPAKRNAFRAALVLAGLALAIQLLALLLEWGSLTISDFRLSRALLEQARLAGLTDVSDVDNAAAAVARQDADLRHQTGKPASTDALPLLARAAPTLAAASAIGVKSIAYRSGTWTLELSTTDAASISQISKMLDQAGLRSVSAPVSGGTRMRVTLDPAYR